MESQVYVVFALAALRYADHWGNGLSSAACEFRYWVLEDRKFTMSHESHPILSTSDAKVCCTFLRLLHVCNFISSFSVSLCCCRCWMLPFRCSIATRCSRNMWKWPQIARRLLGEEAIKVWACLVLIKQPISQRWPRKEKYSCGCVLRKTLVYIFCKDRNLPNF